MRVVQTAPNGVVGLETVFHFTQTGSVVEARYSGGRIAAGYLVGILENDVLSFRYCQVSDGTHIDGGASRGVLEKTDGGRIRLTETFAWESREGTGVNVWEETVP
jgi:hypothetical protein